MTASTERDEIFASVVTQIASASNVVDMQIRHAATVLTSPAIAFENRSVKFAIRLGVEAEARASKSRFTHANLLRPSENACFS